MKKKLSLFTAGALALDNVEKYGRADVEITGSRFQKVLEDKKWGHLGKNALMGAATKKDQILFGGVVSDSDGSSSLADCDMLSEATNKHHEIARGANKNRSEFTSQRPNSQGKSSKRSKSSKGKKKSSEE